MISGKSLLNLATRTTGCLVLMIAGACNAVPQSDHHNDNTNGSDNTPPASVYGDGSAGARVITEDIRLGDQGDTNLQYTDFTVHAGVTLTVQSGTVIRCTGRFRNFGTIIVQTGAEGGVRMGFDSSTVEGVSIAPEAGISTRAASNGEIGGSSAARSGGGEGTGLSEFESFVTLLPGVKAGGGGGAATSAGASGGGSFAVIAGEDIEQNGAISAPGADSSEGGGGGGGGVVILASRESITQSGSAFVSVEGGSGGDSTSDSGAGGGGGGGIVHFVAPVITNAAGASAAGGAAGADGPAGSVTASMRSGGGGGGASAGSGGGGGNVSEGADADAEPAEAGSDGFILSTLADPTAMF